MRASIYTFLLFSIINSWACSMFFYIHPSTGQMFVINNEDYWLDTKAYIKIEKRTSKEYGRLWFGWKNFAQGGINDQGLFFDVAVTPEQKIDSSYNETNKQNLGDDILAHCANVNEAVEYLDKRKIALKTGHFFFSDKKGNAIVLEWINYTKSITQISNNRLVATNFILKDTLAGNYPCWRYKSINERIDVLQTKSDSTDIKEVGQCIAGAVQVPQKNDEGKLGGTLYTTFYDYQTGEFVCVPKLNSTKAIKLHLQQSDFFDSRRKIKL